MLEKRIEQLEERKTALEAESETNLAEMTARVEDKNNFQRALHDRNLEFSKYSKKFQCEVAVADVNSEVCERIFKCFTDRIDQLTEEKEQLEQDEMAKIKSAEKEKEEVQSKRAQLEAESKVAKRRIDEIENEIDEFNQQLENASQNTADFNRCKKKEERLSKEYESKDWEAEGTKFDERIEELKRDKIDTQSKIEDLEADEEDAKLWEFS